MAMTDGGCLCGDVHFALTFPSKWVAHCHCSLCRRAHGAAFVTWIGMEDTCVAIDDPHSRLRWYASTPGACGLFSVGQTRSPGNGAGDEDVGGKRAPSRSASEFTRLPIASRRDCDADAAENSVASSRATRMLLLS